MSRACDSQARDCSGDINMAVKRAYFFWSLLSSIGYYSSHKVGDYDKKYKELYAFHLNG